MRSRPRRAIRFATCVLVLFGLLHVGCARTPPPGSAATPMGNWAQWQTLDPLTDMAKGNADKATLTALSQARQLLSKGKVREADRSLAKTSMGLGRHWISVARADLAALHFTLCIRGVAWRLPANRDEAMTRRIDFNPETKVEPGDVSVEALLTNLDAAIQAAESGTALETQARIARARVTAFTASCAPNDEVSRRANGIMQSDLATLAAEAHLTPDLAYVWAGVQMSEFSGAAARPFLLQAREGGFDDPSVEYMLAVIALEQGELEEADTLAEAAAKRYAKLGNIDQQAQCEFVRGEVARTGKNAGAARDHYLAAMKLVEGHVAALVGLVRVALDADGDGAATEVLHEQLPGLLLGTQPLAPAGLERVATNLETLVIMTNEEISLAEIARSALLDAIDDETDPMRRGLRYFYAATLDARLGDYQTAIGHGVLAQDEFEETSEKPPVDVRRFLDRLQQG